MTTFQTRRYFLCHAGLVAGAALFGLIGKAPAQAAPTAQYLLPDGNPVITQDYTSSAYQKTFNQRTALNERLLHISITNQAERVCYKATWTTTDGPAWLARHALTSKQFQTQLDNYASQGYRPLELSAYTLGTSAYFGGLWEQSVGPDWQVYKDLSPTDFAAKDKILMGQGYHLTQSCKYSADSKPLVVGLWQK